MGVRARNDPIPLGERTFILASIQTAMEEGDVPVKVRNFGSKKPEKGGSK